MNNVFSLNSCHSKEWQLFIFLLLLSVSLFLPGSTYGHQSPTSVILLDVRPDKVDMELQLPVPELELAFGHGPIADPETLIKKMGPQLKEYLLAHIHAYVTQGAPWQIAIESMKMDNGKYLENNITYWEVVVNVTLKPQVDESTSNFLLDYDVIMHEVINHTAFVSIRNDWEAGVNAEHPVEAGVIRVDTGSNTIAPLIINQQGSQWNGFKNMVSLGIQHISEGTDHLLFILVLLLSAPLTTAGGKWESFGGTRYSIVRLIKVVTSFTIGHSLTLLIGAVGLFQLPAQPIEVMIAFSILISAIHAIYPIFSGREAFVAGAFGLVHGMAFAGTLENLNLAPMQMALSILGFNIGIEMMQLVVIAFVVPWFVILSRFPVYKGIRIGGAIFAGVAALGWMIERIITQANPVTVLVDQLFHYSPWIVVILALCAILVTIQSRLKAENK